MPFDIILEYDIIDSRIVGGGSMGKDESAIPIVIDGKDKGELIPASVDPEEWEKLIGLARIERAEITIVSIPANSKDPLADALAAYEEAIRLTVERDEPK